MFLHTTIIHRHVYNCITLRHWNVNHISRLDRVLGFMYTQSGGKSNMVISGNFPNQIEVLMVKSKDVGKSPINYKHWHFNGKIISPNEQKIQQAMFDGGQITRNPKQTWLTGRLHAPTG